MLVQSSYFGVTFSNVFLVFPFDSNQIMFDSFQVDFYVKIFPKVTHGWTTRYEDEDEVAVKSAEEAHQNLLDWFAKYIK